MRLLVAARSPWLAVVLGACVQVPVAPPPIVVVSPEELTDRARCEIELARSTDPLHRAFVVQRLTALRELRERVVVTPWAAEPGLDIVLPSAASGLHRRWRGPHEPVIAYRERSRLQAQLGVTMAALANDLLAREHALHPVGNPPQLAVTPTATTTAAMPGR